MSTRSPRSSLALLSLTALLAGVAGSGCSPTTSKTGAADGSTPAQDSGTSTGGAPSDGGGSGDDGSEDGGSEDGGSDGTDSGSEDGTGDSATPCDPGEGQPGELVSITLNHDGEARTAQLRLPADYDCTPRPLLIGLHGYYGSGRGFVRDTARLEDTLDAAGTIGIFPDGLAMGDRGWKASVTSFNDIDSHNSTGPDGATCTDDAYDYDVFDNCPSSESEDACNWGTSCADTEGFVRALVELAKADFAADPQRVYLTGFSQGGQTTQSLAWRMQDVLAAASPHHGFSANGYTVGPTQPVGLFQVWAPGDRTVDGNDQPSSDGMIYDGAAETAAVWADSLGCAGEATSFPTDADGTREWTCVSHADCSTGVEVVSCTWGGRHTWGRTDSIDFASDQMFEFFARHRRADL